MTTRKDLVVIGAGPAGMAAAIAARSAGLDVLVVDEQPAPGGQIWRSVEDVAGTPRMNCLGKAYAEGQEIVGRFRGSGADYRPDTQIWQIEPGYRVFMSRNGQASVVEAAAILLATGAQERPSPFPGWTLPGVLTVGAAQILLKNAGQVPEEPVWVAGSGPLPLLYLSQLAEAGGRIAGYLDTTPPGQLGQAIRHLPGAWASWREIGKGLGWIRALRRAGVPIIRHVTRIEAEGQDQLRSLRYSTASGRHVTVPASVLLVHEGLVPGIHVTMSLGCDHRWDAAQECHVPVLDEWGETSQPGIFVAGDGAGIAGAKAALLRGEIAALRIAAKAGRLDEARALTLAGPARVGLRRELALRRFLDALYRPRRNILNPDDETVVCRCEEIRAADVRAQVAGGRPGPNQVKAFTRAGMGPCQGRQCGYTVANILAAAERRDVPDIGFYRVRPPLKPLTLRELASLDTPVEPR